MSLNIALMNAISGLQTNSKALDVTAQNVSNVNTVGYSYKTVHQQAVVIAGQGAGVEVASVTRTVNEFMILELRNAVTEFVRHAELGYLACYRAGRAGDQVSGTGRHARKYFPAD